MIFRTLLLGVILLGLTSGWAAHWVTPFFFSLAPDEEVVSGNASVKCRNVRTVLDEKGGPPSCFSVVADDLADGRFQEQQQNDRENEETNDSGLTEREERIMDGLRENYQNSEDD
jgi:hypothetical protein